MLSASKSSKQETICSSASIAGTEFSGPEAAFETLFDGKVNILCNQQESSAEAIDSVRSLFEHMKMRTIFMDSEEHDGHIAYASFITCEFVYVGKDGLEIEKDEKNISIWQAVDLNLQLDWLKVHLKCGHQYLSKTKNIS